jgi:1,4-dihydroxy-2-naphthoyl-CoA hydrolase
MGEVTRGGAPLRYSPPLVALLERFIMSIWFTPPDVDQFNARAENTAIAHLGIELIEIGDQHFKARMPVDQRTHQPMGLLHGGVSMVLAETLASMAAFATLDPSKQFCVGQEINGNHVRSVRSGWVYGVACPLHRGASSQIWEVRICDESERLVCISRVTMAVLNQRER